MGQEKTEVFKCLSYRKHSVRGRARARDNSENMGGSSDSGSGAVGLGSVPDAPLIDWSAGLHLFIGILCVRELLRTNALRALSTVMANGKHIVNVVTTIVSHPSIG